MSEKAFIKLTAFQNCFLYWWVNKNYLSAIRFNTHLFCYSDERKDRAHIV